MLSVMASAKSSTSSSSFKGWTTPSGRQLAIGGAAAIVGAAAIYTTARLLTKRRVSGRTPPYKPPSSNLLVDYTKVSAATTTTPDVDLPVRRSVDGAASYPPYTVFDVFTMAVRKHGDEPALRVERDGSWLTWTWRQYYDDSLAVARAFIALGLKPLVETVAILGFNAPEWLIANLAAIAAGAKAAGIYTSNETDACRQLCAHSHSSIVVVENEVHMKKIIGAAANNALPELKAIILYGPGGISQSYKNDNRHLQLLTWHEVMALGGGRRVDATPAKLGPGESSLPAIENNMKDNRLDTELRKRLNAQSVGHCTTLVYTSGTTGDPKAVMLSHDNLTWTARALSDTNPFFGRDVGYNEHLVSYLPLSHIAAQMVDLHWPMAVAAFLVGNVTVSFARPDALKGSLGITLKMVRPTLLFGVPRVWEKMEEKMKQVGSEASGLKKWIANWAKEIGLEAYRNQQVGGSGEYPRLFWLADRLVYRKVRVALGLDRCKIQTTGAAPIGRSTLEFFGSLDINISEVYGMSECCGPQTAQRPDHYKIGSCGAPMVGTELTVDHVDGRDAKGEGELCYRGRHIMMGYMYSDAATATTVTSLHAGDGGGWMRSGDVGKIDEDGFVYITGRIKELIIGAGGENIAPAPVERVLVEAAPAISYAVMIGDRRKYNIVLITLKCEVDSDGNPTNRLTGLAAKVSPAVTTIEQAVSDPTWKKYIDAAIHRTNQQAISNAARIQKYAILPKDFTIGAELTPQLKVKRSFVATKYRDLIDSLYVEPTTTAAAST